MGDDEGGDSPPPTGRLFRSLRAEGETANTAVPALELDEVVSLRSVTLAAPEITVVGGIDRPAEAERPPLTFEEPPPQPSLWAQDPAAPATPVVAVAAAPVDQLVAGSAPEAVSEPSGRGRRAAASNRGLHAWAVWLVVIGVTVVVAWAEALALGRGIDWITGVALVIASVYAAIAVRRDDALIAVIAPPIAFFLATITAGQVRLPDVGSFLVRESFMVVTTLGNNAAWIFGATIAALIIVLVRRWLGR